jgi:LysM repeat protein
MFARRRASRSRSARARGMVCLLAAVVSVVTITWPGQAGATTVRVSTGATLSQLAHTYGTTVSALVALNGIANPNVVLAGTVLQVPTAAAASSTSTTASSPTSIAVAPGDSLWTIAKRYGTTVGALAQMNGIADPSRVVIGRLLIVPTSSSASVVSATGTAQNSKLPAALLAHPSRLAMIPLFQKWAAAYSVPQPLLEAMSWWESGWQMPVVSSTGAVGVGQLEPSTVRALRVALGNPALDPTNLSDNIQMASFYLHQLLSGTGGNEGLALAGYYQGLVSVRQRGMMPSTVQYVHGILAYTTLFS